TCPEKVIRLKPQIDLRAATSLARVLKEEEPFACIRCGKPFGTRSTIARVTEKLAGKHWMFQGDSNRLDLLKMCEDCRAIAATEASFDPHAPPRTTARATRESLAQREDDGV